MSLFFSLLPPGGGGGGLLLLELAAILADEGSGNAVLVNELPVDCHDVGHLKSEWENPGLRKVESADILWDVLSPGFLL